MNARAAADRAVESVMQLADVLAATLPGAVFERLRSDLAGQGQRTAALVVELARARRQAMEPIAELEASSRDAGQLEHITHSAGRPPQAAADVAGHQSSTLWADDRAVLAAQLMDKSFDLTQLRAHDGALAASTRAAGIYVALVRITGDAHLPQLAASLNNVGVDFANSGRLEDALIAAEQSVAIRRYLAARRPDRFLSDLAVSLNNLGGLLDRAGRPDEAFTATREATEIRIVLAERTPSEYLPVLASSLSNLGINLLKLGRLAEAEAIGHLAGEITARIRVARAQLESSEL